MPFSFINLIISSLSINNVIQDVIYSIISLILLLLLASSLSAVQVTITIRFPPAIKLISDSFMHVLQTYQLDTSCSKIYANIFQAGFNIESFLWFTLLVDAPDNLLHNVGYLLTLVELFGRLSEVSTTTLPLPLQQENILWSCSEKIFQLQTWWWSQWQETEGQDGEVGRRWGWCWPEGGRCSWPF